MNVNHEDVVRRVAEQSPPDGRTADTLLLFALRVLAALPATERAGLLRKDGGENIAAYPPAGVNVSISRLCYPDGTIYKILGDAGPGGENRPQWVDNGTVDPLLWVPVNPSEIPAPPPPTSSACWRPYAGDDAVKSLSRVIEDDYIEAKRNGLDAGSFVWAFRVIWDHIVGDENKKTYTLDESIKKHRGTWRRELGLR